MATLVRTLLALLLCWTSVAAALPMDCHDTEPATPCHEQVQADVTASGGDCGNDCPQCLLPLADVRGESQALPGVHPAPAGLTARSPVRPGHAVYHPPNPV